MNLVIGGTGTVGKQVVGELLERDVHVTVLSRKPKTESNLPDKVAHLNGDLLNPATIRTMCGGMDAVFLLNSVSPTESHEGLMAVNGIRMSQVRQVVYLSVHLVDKTSHLPHFGAKIPIETAIKASEIPYIILKANNFYQNDYWYKDPILKFGVYPQPIGSVGISRVDVRDIAEAAAITLTTEHFHNESYNLAGPDILTGKSTAEMWSKALGKEILYGNDNLDEWERQSLQFMPHWMVFDFRMMYEFFQQKGLKASGKDIERLTFLLGHPPLSFKNFAEETVQIWGEKPAVPV